MIESGDLVLLDFSVVVNGYRGDVANTFIAGGGQPSSRHRELFEACVGAMSAGEGFLRPGMSARVVDQMVRSHLADLELAAFHPGHTGHGLGLGHPEPPYLVPESDDVLAVGDVVTLEPGQYHPGVAGMRFEHNYRITSDGCEKLSGHRITLTRD